jgi:hypothetical protein
MHANTRSPFDSPSSGGLAHPSSILFHFSHTEAAPPLRFLQGWESRTLGTVGFCNVGPHAQQRRYREDAGPDEFNEQGSEVQMQCPIPNEKPGGKLVPESVKIWVS